MRLKHHENLTFIQLFGSNQRRFYLARVMGIIRNATCAVNLTYIFKTPFHSLEIINSFRYIRKRYSERPRRRYSRKRVKNVMFPVNG